MGKAIDGFFKGLEVSQDVIYLLFILLKSRQAFFFNGDLVPIQPQRIQQTCGKIIREIFLQTRIGDGFKSRQGFDFPPYIVDINAAAALGLQIDFAQYGHYHEHEMNRLFLKAIVRSLQRLDNFLFNIDNLLGFLFQDFQNILGNFRLGQVRVVQRIQ